MNQFSDELKQNLTPVYVEKFDLSHPPFSSQFNAALYYETEGRKVIAKKIAHLLDFTKLILFIQGEKGLGKTTLIRQRIRQAKDNWRACFINAKDFTTPELLITKISSDLDVKFRSSASNINNIDLLQEQLEAMRQTGLNPILFIDDIEQINNSIITTLATLIQHSAETQPSLRLVIAGQDITDQLLTIIPSHDNESTLKYLPLPPLTEAESTEYIKHRLQVSSYQFLEPFNKTQIKRIYLDSKGFPTRINKQADHLFTQYTLDYENNKPLIHLNENANKILKYVAGGLSALVVIIIIASLLDTNDSEVASIDIDSNIQELHIPIIKEKQEAMQPSIILEKTQQDIIVTPITEENIEPTITTPALKTPTVTEPKKIITKPVEKLVEQKPKPTTSRTTTTTKNERWIKQQNPKHYTLQLISGGNKAAAIKFIKQHNIAKDATIFQSIYKGRDWYSVIYKSFSSEKAAREGRKSLPRSLRNIKPWTRSFSFIQKSMK